MTLQGTAPAHILLVEDESSIRQVLRTSLEAEGHRVQEAVDALSARTLAGNRKIDLYLIDLGLPDADGLELIRHLRGWTQRPIIVLSARSQEAQKVAALDAGADDFVAKPFGVAELHARIRVALRHARRTLEDGGTVLRFGACEVDLVRKQLSRHGEAVHLTGTQWRLLEVLCRHVGRVVSSQQLLREVWGAAHADQAHYLRIYVRQLRQRLEADPAHPVYLTTETGTGYRLSAEGDGSS